MISKVSPHSSLDVSAVFFKKNINSALKMIHICLSVGKKYWKMSVICNLSFSTGLLQKLNLVWFKTRDINKWYELHALELKIRVRKAGRNWWADFVKVSVMIFSDYFNSAPLLCLCSKTCSWRSNIHFNIPQRACKCHSAIPCGYILLYTIDVFLK